MSFFKLLKYRFVWTGIAFLALFLVQTYAFTGPYSVDRKKKPAPEQKVDFTANKAYHDVAISRDGNILVGNVHIKHDGMVLTCDSAVMYEASNSFLAYGKVHMTDNDSINLTGDSLYYNGTSEFAQVFAHIGKDVVFKHGKMTLYTEILNYDRINERGFYDTGGKLVDGKAVLTSKNGEYHTNDKTALFTNDVLLINNGKDSLLTGVLHYDTRTKQSHATGPTNIYSGGSRIYTIDGYYNTGTGKAQMYDRPQFFNNQRQLIGDSIHYDKDTKRTYAYDNIYFFDPKNNSILLGDYGWYDEENGEAMCTRNAVAKDFSNVNDTLFIHGDTLRLFSYNQKTDSAYRELRGYYHVRAFRSDMQMVCDSLCFVSKDSCLTLYKDPIAWNEGRQILGEEIRVFMNDSTVDSVYIDRQAIMIEQLSDSTLYNQVAGTQMRAYFDKSELREFWVDGNGQLVNYPMEKDSTFLYTNYLEAAKLRAFMENRKLSKLTCFPKPEATTYPLGMAPPEKTKLSGFAWFEWIRPKDKDDIFIWRSKGDENKLKEIPRRNAPMQTLQRLQNKAENKIEEQAEDLEHEIEEVLDDAGLEIKVEE